MYRNTVTDTPHSHKAQIQQEEEQPTHPSSKQEKKTQKPYKPQQAEEGIKSKSQHLPSDAKQRCQDPRPRVPYTRIRPHRI